MKNMKIIQGLADGSIQKTGDEGDEFLLSEFNSDKNQTSAEKIIEVCDAMKTLLLEKNKRYGDSALHPRKIFYKGDSTNSILVRLNDKISRIENNIDELPRINDVCDLIGYEVLLLISMSVNQHDILSLID